MLHWRGRWDRTIRHARLQSKRKYYDYGRLNNGVVKADSYGSHYEKPSKKDESEMQIGERGYVCFWHVGRPNLTVFSTQQGTVDTLVEMTPEGIYVVQWGPLYYSALEHAKEVQK